MSHTDKPEGCCFDDGLISRRRLLSVGGMAALATGVAGCMSGNSGGNGSENLRDPVFTAMADGEPINRHFNPYNPVQFSAEVFPILQNNLWVYNGRTSEWHSRISNEFSLDGKTATLGIDSSYKWNDGKRITATDVIKQLRLEQFLERPIWNYLSSVRKTDDTTIELQLKRSYNEGVFRTFLNRIIVFKRGSAWEQWLDRFKKASGSQNKTKEIQHDLQTWRYAIEDGDPVTHGPCVVEDRSASEWILTPNKHFPYTTNISKWEFPAATTDQQIWQLSISDRLDGTGHFSATDKIKKKYPKHVKHYTIPIVACWSPVINFTRPPWGTREARQALAYLLDRKRLVKNIAPRNSVLHQTTGLPDAAAKDLLPDSRRKQMNQYGIEPKPEQAAERMRAAGLKKRNGKWKMDDGTIVSLEWMGAQWPSSQGIVQTLEQQLPEFGIEFTGTIVSESQWGARRAKGQFGLTHHSLRSATEQTPWLYYDAVIQNKILREQAGHPQKNVKLPPIGEPGGPRQAVDLQELLQQMAVTNDTEMLTDLTIQAAWYINQLLPILPATNAASTSLITTDDWTFPPTDADIMGIANPAYQLLKEPKDDSNKAVLQGKTS